MVIYEKVSGKLWKTLDIYFDNITLPLMGEQFPEMYLLVEMIFLFGKKKRKINSEVYTLIKNKGYWIDVEVSIVVKTIVQ
ncbi:hypothetical protein BZK37_17620 [Enterococcus casseliflavus]|nr:hypothetical protein BZK37_17620 [Enterococcus casseliflavus]